MDMEFGAFLKAKRQERGLTQKQLANLLYVSESAVSKWEKNVAYPSIPLIPKLAELLEVTEHELITASVDKELIKTKSQAKKWRIFSITWSLFFYISYGVALIPCFICNLAINKTLSWFWIVLASLLLSFTFTNLPMLIKKYRLIFIPWSMYSALCILLTTCAIYTKGEWLPIPIMSVLFGLIIIFIPIYIAKYPLFARVRKFNDFVSLFVDFVFLNLLIIVIGANLYVRNGTSMSWCFTIALPIISSCYLLLNLLLCVRFLKVNKLVRTSIILFVIVVLYIIPSFVKSGNPIVQSELDQINIFASDFSNWSNAMVIEQNVHCIVVLSLLATGVAFLTAGIILKKLRKQLS